MGTTTVASAGFEKSPWKKWLAVFVTLAPLLCVSVEGKGLLPYSSESQDGRNDEIARDEAQVRILEDNPERHKELIDVLGRLGRAYKRNGDFARAAELLGRLIEIEKQRSGAESQQTANALLELADVHRAAGNPTAGRPLLEEAHRIRQVHFGPRSDECAESAFLLGTVLQQLGESSRAVDVCRGPSSLARDPSSSLLAKICLVEALYSLKRYEEILEIARQTPAPRRSFDALQSLRAGVTTVVGDVYEELQQWDNAIAYRKETLALREASSGKDDVLTISAMRDLGRTYALAGHTEDALPHLEHSKSATSGNPAARHIHYDSLFWLTAVGFRHRSDEQVLLWAEETLSLLKSDELNPDRIALLEVASTLYFEHEDWQKAASARDAQFGLVANLNGSDHVDLARIGFLAGLALYKAGSSEDALQRLNQSKAVLERHEPPSDPDTLEVTIELADQFWRMRDPRSAIDLFESASTVACEPEAEHDRCIRVLASLGAMYVRTGRFADVEGLLPGIRARCLGSGGTDLDGCEAALQLSCRVLSPDVSACLAERGEWVRRRYGPESHKYANYLIDSAFALRTTDIASAERQLHAGLTSIERVSGKSSWAYTRARMSHAIFMMRISPTQARTIVRAAVSDLDPTHLPDDASPSARKARATDLILLINMMEQVGGRALATSLLPRLAGVLEPEETRSWPEYGRFLSTKRTLTTTDQEFDAMGVELFKWCVEDPLERNTSGSFCSDAALAMSNVHMNAGRYDDALQVLEQGGLGSPLIDPRITAVANSQRALLYALLGRHEQALASFEEALMIEEKGIDSGLTMTADDAALLSFTRTPTLDGLLSMALMPKSGADAKLRAAEWLARRKGRVIDVLAQRKSWELTAAADPSLSVLSNRAVELRARLSEFRVNLGYAVLDRDDIAGELRAVEQEIHSRHRGDEFDVVTQVTASNILKALPPDTALVDFVKFRDYSRNPSRNEGRTFSYVAFVYHKGNDAPAIVSLGDVANIEEAVSALRSESTSVLFRLRGLSGKQLSLAEAELERVYQDRAKRLHDLVWKPLESHLRGATTIICSPDAGLSQIPFEALVDSDGHYLVEQREFAYVTSARDLLTRSPGARSGAVIFAAPVFTLSRSEKDQAIATLGGERPVSSRPLGGSTETEEVMRGLQWDPLPGAETEGSEVATLLRNANLGQVELYKNADALEERFKSVRAPLILHVATHGFYVGSRNSSPADTSTQGRNSAVATRDWLGSQDNPMLRSGLVLAGANSSVTDHLPGDDGWLSAEEVALVDLNGTGLVVLSACETGRGDIEYREGVLGLRRAFVVAGARSLVTSLYKVPDAETRAFMTELYTSLVAGETKSAAIRSAQLESIRKRRANGGAAHPYFWASFILVGDTGRLEVIR